ncbi:MAG: hypothetical protein AAGE05_00290 [Pseudomonadota bacterium]
MEKEFRDKVTFVLTSFTALVALAGTIWFGTAAIDKESAELSLQNQYLSPQSTPTPDTDIVCLVEALTASEETNIAQAAEYQGTYMYRGQYRISNSGTIPFRISHVDFHIYAIPEDNIRPESFSDVRWFSLDHRIQNGDFLIEDEPHRISVDEVFYKDNRMDVSFGFQIARRIGYAYYIEAIGQGGLPDFRLEDGRRMIFLDDEMLREFGARDLRVIAPLSNQGACPAPQTAPE